MKKIRKHKAFTIAELLLAMTIMALLLSALAVAINASMMNLKVNENSFKAINNARQALSRITADLRTSKGVEPSEPGNCCSLVTADDRVIMYNYDSSTGKLMLMTVDDSTDKDYLLCDGVTAMTFTKGLDPEDSGVVRNVQIKMTVESGDISKTVSTAVVIKRNMP